MSNKLQTAELLTAIRAAVQEGLGIPSLPVSLGAPRTPLTVPYAIVAPHAVEVSMTGPGAAVRMMSQKNTFTILVRQAFPTDPTNNIALQKVADSNGIIAKLQPGPSFSGEDILPLVTQVNFAEVDDMDEKVYEIELTFECVTVADHH